MLKSPAALAPNKRGSLAFEAGLLSCCESPSWHLLPREGVSPALGILLDRALGSDLSSALGVSGCRVRQRLLLSFALHLMETASFLKPASQPLAASHMSSAASSPSQPHSCADSQTLAPDEALA